MFDVPGVLCHVSNMACVLCQGVHVFCARVSCVRVSMYSAPRCHVPGCPVWGIVFCGDGLPAPDLAAPVVLRTCERCNHHQLLI